MSGGARGGLIVRLVRFGVPSLVAAAGVVLIAVGGPNEVGLGVLLVGSGGLVAMASALVRVGARSDAERAEEERARAFYARHGRWPE